MAQLNRGADVIFHASGKTGTGVFNAVRERAKFAIGVDADQFHEAPCCILTSMVKGVELAVFETIRRTMAGQFKGGAQELGLAEDGVGYVYDERNAKWIPQEVRDRVEALRRRVIAGEIKVPNQ
jgi:basic membrane protein A